MTTLPKPTAVPTTASYGRDGTTLAAKPWVRFFARYIDGVVFYLIQRTLLVALFGLVLGPKNISPSNYVNQTVFTIALIAISIFGWMFMAAICVRIFATTPGKALLGIRIRNGAGEKLGFADAFAREWGVWVYGLGLCFPPATVILMITSYLRLIDRGDTRWDNDQNAVFFHADCGPLRVLAALSLTLVPFLAFVGAGAAAEFTFANHPDFSVNSPIVFANIQPQPIRVTPLVIPKLPDPRLNDMSGTWISVTTNHSGNEKFTVRNVLTLNPDGTFRQSVRISDGSGKAHPELGHQWSGTWDLDGNKLLQNVSLSSASTYPVGKWGYEMVETRFDSMTLRRTIEPEGFVNAGHKQTVMFQRMTASVRID